MGDEGHMGPEEAHGELGLEEAGLVDPEEVVGLVVDESLMGLAPGVVHVVVVVHVATLAVDLCPKVTWW